MCCRLVCLLVFKSVLFHFMLTESFKAEEEVQMLTIKSLYNMTWRNESSGSFVLPEWEAEFEKEAAMFISARSWWSGMDELCCFISIVLRQVHLSQTQALLQWRRVSVMLPWVHNQFVCWLACKKYFVSFHYLLTQSENHDLMMFILMSPRCLSAVNETKVSFILLRRHNNMYCRPMLLNLFACLFVFIIC